MGNPVVHFEIGCRDSKKTQEFYCGLFDWKFESMGPVVMINTGGDICLDARSRRKHGGFVQTSFVAVWAAKL